MMRVKIPKMTISGQIDELQIFRSLQLEVLFSDLTFEFHKVITFCRIYGIVHMHPKSIYSCTKQAIIKFHYQINNIINVCS